MSDVIFELTTEFLFGEVQTSALRIALDDAWLQHGVCSKGFDNIDLWELYVHHFYDWEIVE